MASPTLSPTSLQVTVAESSEAPAARTPSMKDRHVSFRCTDGDDLKRNDGDDSPTNGLPTLSRASRSSISLVSSVPSVLAPMPGMRSIESVIEPKGLLENHYIMQKTLGKGSYGIVCAVQHRKTKELRALKSIPFTKLEDATNFKEELEIARKLDHPYIVKLFEVFQTGDCIHLVMELCGGGTLANMMASAHNAAVKAAGRSARASFPDDLIGKFMWQMLCGLAYLHHHRIIHRDIKPENYLVQMRKTTIFLKLADFGLACIFKRGKPLKDVLGTPCYVAPEVLSGNYDERCDLWSVGVVSYVFCTGHHPFAFQKGDTAKVVLQRIRNGEMQVQEHDWKNCSQEARDLVFKMVVMDPELRPKAKHLISGSSWLKKHDVPFRSQGSDSCCAVS